MFKDVDFIDLTHNLHHKVPTWTGGCGFHHEIKRGYEDGGPLVMKYTQHAGVGTHMDAPSHFIEGGKTIGGLELKHFFCECVVIDVSKKCCANLMIGVSDIKDYEQRYGKIAPNSLVLGYTGWQQFFHDPDKYRNVNSTGKMEFPGFEEDAAKFLVERNIAGIGIDTLSPDGSNMDSFPVHKTILGAGKYIIENVSSLEKMPVKGGYVVALPPKIQCGAESAIRLVGLVNKG